MSKENSEYYPPPAAVPGTNSAPPQEYPTAQPVSQPYPTAEAAAPPQYMSAQQPQYAPQQPVFASQPAYQMPPLTNYMLSTGPTSGQCPHCQQTITTNCSYKNGMATWLSCGGLCLFGCWLGCCLIPFCVDGLKDVTHHCPNCQRIIGVKSRL